MPRWLARLAFSFFILAGLLFYQAYREMNPATAKPPIWRIALYCLAAGVSIGLGLRGLRDRHKTLSDSRDDDIDQDR